LIFFSAVCSHTLVKNNSLIRSLRAFFKHPKVNHFLILLKFFIFNLLLPGADMTTDILTARNYFLRDHTYWGFYTTFFIFLPFIGKGLIFLVKLFFCFFSIERVISIRRFFSKGWFSHQMYYRKKPEKLTALIHESLPDLIWHFPLFMIFRYTKFI